MRQGLFIGLVMAVIAYGSFGVAQDPPPAPAPPAAEGAADAPADAPANAEAPQTTTVAGTPPDLEGRWLVLPAVGVAQGAKRLVPSVWEVTRIDGKFELRERLIILPPAQTEALRVANDERGGVWDPTAGDLAAIAAGWDGLVPEGRGVAEMVHQVTGRDGFDDDLKKEALSKDALWVVRQRYAFQPGNNRPITQVNLLAPLTREGQVYSGNYFSVAVAAAPFPVPIKFEGTFRLFPLPRESPSMWQRVGDLFAGCNRR
jgi:hypothetical protein